MIGTVARMQLRPGYTEQFEFAARQMVEEARVRDGCVFFGLFRADTPGLYVFMGRWTDKSIADAYSSPARGLKHCGSPARQGAAEGRQPGPQQAATRTGPRATHRVPSYHLSNGSKRASTAWHRAPRPLNTTRPSPRAPLDDRVYRPGRPPSPHAKPRNLRRDERISRNGRKVRAPPTRLPP